MRDAIKGGYKSVILNYLEAKMLGNILVLLISNSVVLAVIAFLIKSLFNHYLTKDIENYKIKLKAEIDKANFEDDPASLLELNKAVIKISVEVQEVKDE